MFCIDHVIFTQNCDAHTAHRQHPTSHCAKNQRNGRQDLVAQRIKDETKRKFGDNTDRVGTTHWQEVHAEGDKEDQQNAHQDRRYAC